jgi:pimeloyl-ACP methyl ester carboxylesterase
MQKAPNVRPALLFLPGLLCDGSVWAYQREALADVAVCTAVEWAAEDSLADMAEIALRSAPERFAVAGHSMGGRVALEVYRAAPERVTHVALLNTGYLPRPKDASGETEARERYALLEVARGQGMRAMAERWIPPMVHPDRRRDPQLTAAITEMFARKTPEIFEAQIHALLNRPDATAVLAEIRCPALLVSGREDTWSPPARHAEMAALIPGAPASPPRLVVVPHSGHMSTLEQPDAVAEALREWLTV